MFIEFKRVPCFGDIVIDARKEQASAPLPAAGRAGGTPSSAVSLIRLLRERNMKNIIDKALFPFRVGGW